MAIRNPSETDPRVFLPLHPLELRILLVLREGSAHGYRIVKEIEAREEELGPIYPGNLYRRIRDLLSRELLKEVPPPSKGDVDSRRKYYEATPLGEAVARAEARRLEGLVREARALGVLTES